MITKKDVDAAWQIIKEWNAQNNINVYRMFYENCAFQLGVTVEDLRGKNRQRELVYRRIIAAYELKKHFPTIYYQTFMDITGKANATLLYYLRKYEVYSDYEDFMEIKNKLLILENEK